MKGTMTVIGVDGRKTVTEFDKSPSLDELQTAVGGHIESVPFFTVYEGKPCWALCNEEGKLNGLPFNATAQRLWEAALPAPVDDALVGSIAILTGDEEFMESL